MKSVNNTLFMLIAITGFILYVSGAMFKIMDLPNSNILLLTGLFKIVFSGSILFFTNKTNIIRFLKH